MSEEEQTGPLLRDGFRKEKKRRSLCEALLPAERGNRQSLLLPADDDDDVEMVGREEEETELASNIVSIIVLALFSLRSPRCPASCRSFQFEKIKGGNRKRGKKYIHTISFVKYLALIYILQCQENNSHHNSA